VKVVDVEPGPNPGDVSPVLRVTRDGGHPVQGARVKFAGQKATGPTGRQGNAQVFAHVDTPGWFSVYVRKGKRFGISKQIPVDITQSNATASPADRG
jgi:hypothetical protein